MSKIYQQIINHFRENSLNSNKTETFLNNNHIFIYRDLSNIFKQYLNDINENKTENINSFQPFLYHCANTYYGKMHPFIEYSTQTMNMNEMFDFMKHLHEYDIIDKENPYRSVFKEMKYYLGRKIITHFKIHDTKSLSFLQNQSVSEEQYGFLEKGFLDSQNKTNGKDCPYFDVLDMYLFGLHTQYKPTTENKRFLEVYMPNDMYNNVISQYLDWQLQQDNELQEQHTKAINVFAKNYDIPQNTINNAIKQKIQHWENKLNNQSSIKNVYLQQISAMFGNIASENTQKIKNIAKQFAENNKPKQTQFNF